MIRKTFVKTEEKRRFSGKNEAFFRDMALMSLTRKMAIGFDFKIITRPVDKVSKTKL